MSFNGRQELRDWLSTHHATSEGIWLRIQKAGSGTPSVTFEHVLDEGLCFGWSESKRLPSDPVSYLQRFTPRRKRGTTSARNKRRATMLVAEGKMTNAGLWALGWDVPGGLG